MYMWGKAEQCITLWMTSKQGKEGTPPWQVSIITSIRYHTISKWSLFIEVRFQPWVSKMRNELKAHSKMLNSKTIQITDKSVYLSTCTIHIVSSQVEFNVETNTCGLQYMQTKVKKIASSRFLHHPNAVLLQAVCLQFRVRAKISRIYKICVFKFKKN